MRLTVLLTLWSVVPFTTIQSAVAGTLSFSIADGTGAAVACRIHLKDAAGKPVHSAHLPFWGDHFVCSGRANVEVSGGRYTYDVERGPEYRRVNGAVEVAPSGRSEVRAVLARIADMSSEGWSSGDLHVHRPVSDISLLLQAEDLHVASVITWWNNHDEWFDKVPPADTVVRFDSNRFYDILAGEDEREGGALLYFGLKRPLPIAGASREFPSPMKFVELARAAPNAWIDVEKPFWWDVPVWLASGTVDSIGLANNHMCRSQMIPNEAWGKPRDRKRLPGPLGNGYWSQEIYYHILNTGLRIPPTAGSASGVLPNPVGYNRVYAHVGNDMTPKRWRSAVKAGQSFVTNGPLLRVTADGEAPGHVFTAVKEGRVTVRLSGRLSSNDPVRAYEIVQNGEVVRAIPTEWNAQTLQTATTDLGAVDFDSSGWLLVRAITDNPVTFRFASTAPFYVEIGESRRRISHKNVMFFRDWVDERIERVKKNVTDPLQQAEILRYHDEGRAFWEKRLREANAP